MEGRPPKKCFVQTLSLTVGEWVGVIGSNIFIENIQDVYVKNGPMGVLPNFKF